MNYIPLLFLFSIMIVHSAHKTHDIYSIEQEDQTECIMKASQFKAYKTATLISEIGKLITVFKNDQEKFREFKAEINNRFVGLSKQMTRHEQDINRLTMDQSELDADIADLERRLDKLETTQRISKKVSLTEFNLTVPQS